jgi:hypothetical protein
MPRKRSPEGKPTDAEGTLLKAVRVELPPPLHNELRVEAARCDQSMAAYVRGLIETHFANLGPPPKKKRGA